MSSNWERLGGRGHPSFHTHLNISISFHSNGLEPSVSPHQVSRSVPCAGGRPSGSSDHCLGQLRRGQA